jgi:hypothetical protein
MKPTLSLDRNDFHRPLGRYDKCPRRNSSRWRIDRHREQLRNAAPRITSYNQHSLAQSSRIWNDNVLPIQLEVKLGSHSFPLMTQKPDAIQTVETLTDAGTMLPGIQHTCVRPPRSRVCVMWSALRIDSNAIWLDRPCLPQWCSRRGTDPESQSLHGVKQ